ncbi:outer membrane protein assembly factor BamD [Magnetofaba australis]|nr:outer membrane protein assembly factor BamD [Magnetofaba australis]
MTLRALLAALLLLTLAACSSTPDEDVTPDLPPETLYRQATEALKQGQYTNASRMFSDLDQRHPFSPWAVRAQINLIYADFKREEFAEAISHAERFIRLHPRHPEAAYAYYMRGLAHYRQVKDAYRDQDRTRKAAAAFREVVNRFPTSDYAWEAKQMLDHCIYRMAEQEMVVARYYLDRENWLAAYNRFSAVVESKEYSATPLVEEALFSLLVIAKKLGLDGEARNYAAVLGHNFPNGRFYPLAPPLVEGRGGISKSQLASLRTEVDEGSFFARFFEGLKPGVLTPGN